MNSLGTHINFTFTLERKTHEFRLQQYIPDDEMTKKVVFMMLPLLGKGFQVALLKPASLDPHCFPYMSVHYNKTKIEIQNFISFAFFLFFFQS